MCPFPRNCTVCEYRIWILVVLVKYLWTIIAKTLSSRASWFCRIQSPHKQTATNLLREFKSHGKSVLFLLSWHESFITSGSVMPAMPRMKCLGLDFWSLEQPIVTPFQSPWPAAGDSNVQARVSDRPIWPIWIHHEPTSAFPVSHKPQHAWIWAKGQEASQSSIRQSALMISGRRFASCQLNPFKSQRGGLQTSLSEKNQWVTPRTFVESIFSVLLHLRLVHGWAISPSVVEVLLPVVKYYYYYVV